MKIELEIRSFGSPDIDFGYFDPVSSVEIFFLVELEIGENGVGGADLFQVVVATPEALRERAKSFVLAERTTLIVAHYHWPSIENALRSIVKKCEAESWVASTFNLQRFFHWEYEDF